MNDSPPPAAARPPATPDLPRDFSGPAQLAGMVLASLLDAGGAPSRLLVAYPPEPGLPASWAPVFPTLDFLYDDYSVFLRDREPIGGEAPVEAQQASAVGGLGLHFGWSPPEGWRDEPPFDLAVLFLPKGNDAIEAAFHHVTGVVAPGGRVLVVGAKKSGIVSSRKVARRVIGAEVAAKSARHAKLYAYRRPASDRAAPAPAVRRSFEKTYAASAWGQEVRVVSLPGVFSHGRLDDGTRFLLEETCLDELGDWGAALDFGCGAGVLTAALRLARPGTRVDAVDRQAQALEATQATLAANGLDTDGSAGRVFPSDVFSDVPPSRRYDLILTNPPFHSGHATDFSMTHRLIAGAASHLTPEGRLVTVTNTFIDYLTPLRDAFRKVEVLHQSTRYRVTRSSSPR